MHAAIEDAGPGDEDVVGGARSQTSRFAELHRVLVGLLDLGEHGEVGRADVRGEPGDLVHVGHRERLEDVLGIEVSLEVLLPRSNVRGLVCRVWAHPAGVAVDRDGVDGVEGGSCSSRGYHNTIGSIIYGRRVARRRDSKNAEGVSRTECKRSASACGRTAREGTRLRTQRDRT